MGESRLVVGLMATGSVPAVIALVATVWLWLGRRQLTEEAVRGWARCGYGWLAGWVVVALVLTEGAEASPVMVAMGWIATPCFASIIGLWVFTERQRLALERWPSVERMAALTESGEQEAGFLLAELLSDLDRATASVAALENGSASPRPLSRDRQEAQDAVTQVRATVQRLRELQARLAEHRREVAAAARDAADPETVARLQADQAALAATGQQIVEASITCRNETNRVLANLLWN